MKPKNLLLLFIAGLILSMLPVLIQTNPGYMDAEYYYANGLRLFDGFGFTQPFVWNYLNGPLTIPQPSHIYWMPLTSIAAFLGMAMFNARSFIAARTIFILLNALIPVLTYSISYTISKNNKIALFAGGIALFPGFYFPYLSITDSFSLYMVIGGLFILLILRVDSFNKGFYRIIYPLILGVLSGLLHLARADGLLWLIFAIIFMLVYELINRKKTVLNPVNNVYLGLALNIGILLITYFAVTGFWYIRNYELYGAIIPPGGSKTLWLTDYGQMASYPSNQLNFAHWIDYGWKNILADRIDALIINLGTTLYVQTEVILLPFIIAGIYKYRKNFRISYITLLWVLLLIAMSFVFPYAGKRGGFFHSGAAYQPFLWAMAAAGFDGFVGFGCAKRKWNFNQAFNVLGIGFVLIMIFYTGFVFIKKVVGIEQSQVLLWNQSWEQYEDIYQFIDTHDQSSDRTVLTDNPPRYYLVSGDNAAVIPNGDLDTLLEVAHLFNAKYLILEKVHVPGLDFVYQNPMVTESLTYLGMTGDTKIFSINLDY